MDTVTFHVEIGEYPETTAELIHIVRGLVVGIGVAYNLGPYSSSIDIDITEQDDNVPTQDIWSLANQSTDGWFYPVAQVCGVDGALIAATYNLGIPVYGDVSMMLSNGMPGDSVDITFRLVR